MYKNSVEWSVVINGGAAKEYQKDGKTFIESRVGTHYSIKIKNNEGRRILVIPSVDGINCLTGEIAGESKKGYVINAYDSISIKGYRLDDQKVASFQFVKSLAGYANTVGAKFSSKAGEEYVKTTDNNGVIAIRVYREQINYNVNSFVCKNLISSPPSLSDPYFFNVTWGGHSQGGSYNSYSAPAFNNFSSVARSCSSPPAFEMGSSFGKEVSDKVVNVEFNPESTYEQYEIYYDTRESLEKFGIDFDNKKAVAGWPKGFAAKSEYCKPPPGWERSQ